MGRAGAGGGGGAGAGEGDEHSTMADRRGAMRGSMSFSDVSIVRRGLALRGNVMSWSGVTFWCWSRFIGAGENDHQPCPKLFLFSPFEVWFAVRSFPKFLASLDLQAPQLLPKLVPVAVENLFVRRAGGGLV